MLYNSIKKLALKRGISIRELEIKTNLSNGSISKWNASVPRADTLDKVARYLGTTSEQILNKSSSIE